MKDNSTTTHKDGADPWATFQLSNAWSQQSCARKHTKKVEGGTKSGAGKATGWDFWPLGNTKRVEWYESGTATGWDYFGL